MIVYRLAKQKFCNDLSGKGAEITGGRWNSKGKAMLYTSSSRALCMAEVAVHIPMGIIPEKYFLVHIQLPTQVKMIELQSKDLPDDWNKFPHSQQTQSKGDLFLYENKYLILKVPSAVVQGDYNYLINPKHPQHSEIKVLKCELFSFDERLFR